MIAIILLLIILAFSGDPEALGWGAVVLFFLVLGYFGLLDWI